jgi:hypothetical protein
MTSVTQREDGLWALAGPNAWRLGLFDGVATSGYDGMALKNVDIDPGSQRERMPTSSHPANPGQGPHMPRSTHPHVRISDQGWKPVPRCGHLGCAPYTSSATKIECAYALQRHLRLGCPKRGTKHIRRGQFNANQALTPHGPQPLQTNSGLQPLVRLITVRLTQCLSTTFN